MGGSIFVIFGLFAMAGLAGLSGGGGGSDPDTDQSLTNENDTLESGSGDDIIDARGGGDVISTNAGDDNVRLGSGDDIWLDIDVNDINNLTPTSPVPNSGDDTISGGTGDDELLSISGSDVLDGGFGDDYLVAVDKDFDSTTGATLPDASDTLIGGAGDDSIIGDDGDVLTGGTGADVFGIFLTQDPLQTDDASTDTAVHITDFDPDEDMLQVETNGGLGFSFDEVIVEEDSTTGDILLRADGITFARLSGIELTDLNASNFSVFTG